MLRLSPYFEAVGRRPRPCPECGHRLALEPLELTWDGAVWRCQRCGWFQLEQAPEAARMGPREVRVARVVAPDFGGGRHER